MHSIQRVITRSSNAAKRVRAFNPSHYERAFDVRLVLSGTVAKRQNVFTTFLPKQVTFFALLQPGASVLFSFARPQLSAQNVNKIILTAKKFLFSL